MPSLLVIWNLRRRSHDAPGWVAQLLVQARLDLRHRTLLRAHRARGEVLLKAPMPRPHQRTSNRSSPVWSASVSSNCSHHGNTLQADRGVGRRPRSQQHPRAPSLIVSLPLRLPGHLVQRIEQEPHRAVAQRILHVFLGAPRPIASRTSASTAWTMAVTPPRRPTTSAIRRASSLIGTGRIGAPLPQLSQVDLMRGTRLPPSRVGCRGPRVIAARVSPPSGHGRVSVAPGRSTRSECRQSAPISRRWPTWRVTRAAMTGGTRHSSRDDPAMTTFAG